MLTRVFARQVGNEIACVATNELSCKEELHFEFSSLLFLSIAIQV